VFWIPGTPVRNEHPRKIRIRNHGSNVRSGWAQHGRSERADTWVCPYIGFFTGEEYGFHDRFFTDVNHESPNEFFENPKTFSHNIIFYQIATLL
jgi:hypothetical protein